MNSYLYKTALLSFVVIGTIVSSCKKDKTDDSTDDSSEELSISSDESGFSAETEQALQDANTVLSGSSLAGAKVAAVSICGATIDSSQKANGIITLSFDGTSTCIYSTRTRSGSITLSLPAGTKWADAGAKLTVTFNNYKVTRISDGKSITLSGSKVVTNVNGGLARNLTSGSSLVHTIRGSITVTFDDNSQRSWQIARKRTTSLSGSVYSIKIEGDTTVSGNTNIDVWGTNRYGNMFYASLTNPVVYSSACNYHAVSGEVVHQGLLRTVTATFGVDQSGNAVSSGCPYGYKVSWTNIRGVFKQAIVQY